MDDLPLAPEQHLGGQHQRRRTTSGGRIRKRTYPKSTRRQDGHRGVLVGKSPTLPGRVWWRPGVHEDFPTYKKKK